MQKLSFREALHACGLFSLLTRAFAVLVALGCFIATAWTQTAEKRTDLAIRPEFREPVVLASKEGVLEVRLTARQGPAATKCCRLLGMNWRVPRRLWIESGPAYQTDTVAALVQNFLLFDYEVVSRRKIKQSKPGTKYLTLPTPVRPYVAKAPSGRSWRASSRSILSRAVVSA
jgi:hypothetical protein